VLQCELVSPFDDVPELDGVVTAGTGQNVVGVGVEGDIADLSLWG
jgi:hypothetical protein